MEEQNPLQMPKGSVRAILAIIAVGSLCYLAIRQMPIPENLKDVVLIVLAFYFGTRAGK